MLLVIAAVVGGSLAGWAAGGRFGRVPWVPPVAGWRWPGLLGAGALMLLVGGRWIPGLTGLVVLVGGYGLTVVFATANCRRTGLVLVGVGLIANASVILADRGMPVKGVPAAVATALHHHGLSSRDHLTALADDIRLPAGHETVSPGDILIALGGAVAVFSWLAPSTLRSKLRSFRENSRRGEGGRSQLHETATDAIEWESERPPSPLQARFSRQLLRARGRPVPSRGANPT